jgi:hypothetical protein
MATKDYTQIAAQRVTKPSQLKRRPKFLIYSRNKKGKTTFGISAGVAKTLVIDPEHGTDEMRSKDPNVWHIERWEDLDDVYYYLREGKHPYEWVVVDGLTKISNMSLKYVMKLQEEKSLDRIPGMVQQRDYGKAGELMKDLLTRFHNLNMGVVFTAQERMEDPGDSEEDEDVEEGGAIFVPDLPKGVRGYANSIVDVIGRIYVVKIDGVPERRLWVGESIKYDTGYRSDFVLPDYIQKPSIPKVVLLMRTGKATRPTASR